MLRSQSCSIHPTEMKFARHRDSDNKKATVFDKLRGRPVKHTVQELRNLVDGQHVRYCKWKDKSKPHCANVLSLWEKLNI